MYLCNITHIQEANTDKIQTQIKQNKEKTQCLNDNAGGVLMYISDLLLLLLLSFNQFSSNGESEQFKRIHFLHIIIY